MYGQPLEPKRTSFSIDVYDSEISINLIDLDDTSNDNIRDVVHPDWDDLFSNMSEGVFEVNDQRWIDEYSQNKDLKALITEDEIKTFLLSIGMVEDQNDDRVKNYY